MSIDNVGRFNPEDNPTPMILLAIMRDSMNWFQPLSPGSHPFIEKILWLNYLSCDCECEIRHNFRQMVHLKCEIDGNVSSVCIVIDYCRIIQAGCYCYSVSIRIIHGYLVYEWFVDSDQHYI